MPFTPTHILAILPIAALRRSPLPFSALVIGSMIPDLPLFVAIAPEYGITHSVGGLFTACLPLGLAWFLGFQIVMKRPLFALLPAAIRRRCADFSTSCLRGPKTVIYAAIAVVVGAATHVFWDSFTHEGRWGTRQFPLLNEKVVHVAGHGFTGSKLLQYGCTTVGLPWLALLAARWLARQAPGPVETPTLPGAWRAVVILAALAAPVAAGALAWRRFDLPIHDRAFRAVTTSGMVLIVVATLFCLAFRAVEGPPPRRG